MNESQTIQQQRRQGEICREEESRKTKLGARRSGYKTLSPLTAKNNLVGMTFSDWRVISRPRQARAAYWCRCKCGAEKIIEGWFLIHGVTKRCNRHLRERNMTHGMKGTHIYKVWDCMKQRCYNPNHKSYSDYGGRGIFVCDRWKDSFEHFLADMGIPDRGLLLDRIDNNGIYEPSNCRWATSAVQANNKRNNTRITAFGETKTLSQWGSDPRCVVGIETLIWRISRARTGWPHELAITKPAAPNDQTWRQRKTKEAVSL